MHFIKMLKLAIKNHLQYIGDLMHYNNTICLKVWNMFLNVAYVGQSERTFVSLFLFVVGQVARSRNVLVYFGISIVRTPFRSHSVHCRQKFCVSPDSSLRSLSL